MGVVAHLCLIPLCHWTEKLGPQSKKSGLLEGRKETPAEAYGDFLPAKHPSAQRLTLGGGLLR